MKPTSLLVALLAFVCSGCSESKARVKGKVVENAQPMSFGANQAALELTPIGASGEADPNKMYTAVVNADGSFEVVVSGGELPLGKYQVAFRAFGKLTEKYKSVPPFQRELKAGLNELILDLAKPD